MLGLWCWVPLTLASKAMSCNACQTCALSWTRCRQAARLHPGAEQCSVRVSGMHEHQACMRMHIARGTATKMVVSVSFSYPQPALHAQALADCSQQRTADRVRLLCIHACMHIKSGW